MAPKVYRVVNRHLVAELAPQLGLEVPLETSVASDLALGAKGLGRSRRRETKFERSLPQLAEQVAVELRDRGLLGAFRPERADEFYKSDSPEYVFEVVEATPVYLPLDDLALGDRAPEALTVWVADPPTDLHVPAADEWDWAGAFLFLVEELAVMERPGPWFVSGVSALRLLVEYVARKNSLSFGELRDSAHDSDEFGRWNEKHPIEKLVTIGGVPLRERTIETIYRIVYMTNEQAHTVDGQAQRVNDILAYPLYIAE